MVYLDLLLYDSIYVLFNPIRTGVSELHRRPGGHIVPPLEKTASQLFGPKFNNPTKYTYKWSSHTKIQDPSSKDQKITGI